MMLTGLNDTESIERAYAAGATDFVTKPINWLLLTQRVRYGLRARRAQAAVRHGQQSLERAQRLARMGSWEWSLPQARFSCSDAVAAESATTSNSPAAAPRSVFSSGCVRATVRSSRGAAAVMSEGTPYQATYGLRRGDGSLVEVFEEGDRHPRRCRPHRHAGRDHPGHQRAASRRSAASSTWRLHDQLTGLANRQFFNELVDAGTRARAARREPCAIIHIDLDHFKSFNDALGDASGDGLLCGSPNGCSASSAAVLRRT
jgi:hypothetical protein